MSYWGWPCACPQCLGDDEPEYDDFEEWALDEAERQFDVAASHDVEPELRCIPQALRLKAVQSEQGTCAGEN